MTLELCVFSEAIQYTLYYSTCPIFTVEVPQVPGQPLSSLSDRFPIPLPSPLTTHLGAPSEGLSTVARAAETSCPSPKLESRLVVHPSKVPHFFSQCVRWWGIVAPTEVDTGSCLSKLYQCTDLGHVRGSTEHSGRVSNPNQDYPPTDERTMTLSGSTEKTGI